MKKAIKLSNSEKMRIEGNWVVGISRDMVPKHLNIWWEAAKDAVDEAEEPEDSDAKLYWALGLAVNTLAFAAMFYPTTAVIGIITGAAQITTDFGVDMSLGLAKEREAKQTRAGRILTILGSSINLYSQLLQYPKDKR